MNSKMFLIVVLILLMIYSCTDNTIDPIDNNKSKRDLSWTVDTLSYPGSYQTLMRNIWGSSKEDVYTVGHNDGGFGKMYHFNGEIWEPVKLTQGQGGLIQGPIDLNYIYGLDANNIWATGVRFFWSPSDGGTYTDSSLIIYFNGVDWIDQPIHGNRSISSLWAADISNAWATTSNGFVYNFNGIEWREETELKDINLFSIYGSSTTNIFAIGNRLDEMPYDSVINYVFHYNGESWTKVDSVYEHLPPFTRNSVWLLNNNDIYIAGWGVFKREKNSWTRIFNEDTWITKVRGTSHNNLIAVGYESGIYHYNGDDWYKYEQFYDPQIVITGVWTDGYEVFATGSNGYVTFVYHGK